MVIRLYKHPRIATCAKSTPLALVSLNVTPEKASCIDKTGKVAVEDNPEANQTSHLSTLKAAYRAPEVP
jgi:hypothetical protein